MTVPPVPPVGQQPPPFPAASVPPSSPTPAPKRAWYKKWWIWVILVVALLIFGSAIGSGGRSNTAAPDAGYSPAASNAGKANQPKVGTPVTVNDVTVTLKSFGSVNRLSNVLGKKSGHWVTVTVTVANRGKDAITIDNSSFTLQEPDGTTFETDSDALAYVDPSKSLFLKKINPKNAATGQLLFAVPSSAKDLTMVFKPSIFGQEARIQLRK